MTSLILLCSTKFTLHVVFLPPPTPGLIDHVTVLIGIAVKGEPVAGVIHKPFVTSAGERGHTYWALKGLGTRGVNVTPNKPPPTTEELRVVITRTHYTDLIHQTVEAMKPKEVVRMGGCGHKTMLVVEGGIDAYVFPNPGTKKWDTCAGDAIVRAAGGLMTDINGKRFDYSNWDSYQNKMGLVVTMCKETHQTIINKIPKEVVKALESE